MRSNWVKNTRLGQSLRSAILIASVAGLSTLGHYAWAQEEGGGQGGGTGPGGRTIPGETGMKITAPFTVAAVGDIIEPQPLYSSDPHFQELIDHIRKADVGFANFESTLVDFRNFQGGIAGTEAPLEMGAAVKAMGITIVNHANNHTFDGGVFGMESTDDELDRLGIAHAGTGKNLQDARAAAFEETPKGRVGLVGMFSTDDVSTYGPNYAKAEATEWNGKTGGAPGENTLHLTTYHIVSAEQLQTLRSVSEQLFGSRGAGPTAPAEGMPDRFKFFDEWYQAGTDPGALRYEMNKRDENAVLASIRDGKLMCDFMIVTIHAHQTTTYKSQGVGGADHNAADFLVKLAHDSIDNGADEFVAHGVHALHGIEIYKGKPVFYGVSNFVFQFPLQFGMGGEAMATEKGEPTGLEIGASQETVLTTTHWEGGKLTEVRIYPVDLGGRRRPMSQLGIPMTPSPEDAQRILKEMQEFSKPFGTTIAIENNVGVIRISEQGHGNSTAQ
jgi:poly-gamma-glutamate capsule biosynthesis protein CapA/YwtB (metallophosphatase superfamily)